MKESKQGMHKNDTLDTHDNKHELGKLRDSERKIAFDKIK